MQEQENKKREVMNMARLTSVGIQLVLCIIIGYFIGHEIDKHAHTAPVFMYIFLALGIGSGMINVFRTLGKIGD
jgi:ATP synthase protein I